LNKWAGWKHPDTARPLFVVGKPADGESADTGAMLTPYLRNAGTDTAPKWMPGKNVGELYFPPQVLNPLLLKAVQAGLDPHLHATGDRAVRYALNGIE
jgi:predicted amidohydrolase YtcJ